MSDRRYYSIRTGKNPNAQKIDLAVLNRLFRDLYYELWCKGYFQEAFGYLCATAGEVAGTLGYGHDIGAQIFRALRKPSLWPILKNCLKYSEDDLFDVIEFLFDYVSKPMDGSFHSDGDCGWHYDTFDKNAGQRDFRDRINEILQDYNGGYELSKDGEILELAEQGLEDLFTANLPTYDPENVEQRVEVAILKFRRYHSTPDERKDAVRDLADVLEFMRPKVQKVLTRKDEGDLFALANNFGIRHHETTQQTDYDKEIWYSWMFYYYLSTIHACLKLIKKRESEKVQ